MMRFLAAMLFAGLAGYGTVGLAFAQQTTAPDDPAAVAALKRMNAGVVNDETGRVTSLAPPRRRVAEALQHVPSLSGLSSLDLRKTTVADEDLRHIARAGQLKVLNLSHTGIGDAGIAHIVKVKTLESLDLSFTRITDEGVAALTELSNMQYLRLQHTQVTNAGAALLENLPCLRFLDVWGTDVDEDTINQLRRGRRDISFFYEWDDYRAAEIFRRHGVAFQMNEAGRLVTVRIDPDDWREEVVAVFLRLDHVEELHLAYCRVDDRQVAELAQMQRLKTLDLCGTLITDEGMVHLGQLPGLGKLDLRRTVVTAAGLENISRWEDLTELFLSHRVSPSDPLLRRSPTTPEGVSRRAGPDRVGIRIESTTHYGQRRLVVVGSGVSDAMLKVIARLRNVGWAAFPDSSITDAGLRHMETWTRLRELKLASPHVTDTGMVAVAKIHYLRHLALDCPQVGAPGLTHLAKLPSLQTLLIRSDRVTSGDVPELGHLTPAKLKHIHSGAVTRFGYAKLKDELPNRFMDLSTPRWPSYYVEERAVMPR